MKDQKHITSDYLKAVVASWLRYEKQCVLVTMERGLDWRRNPDVFGVNKTRTTIEVEVKISFHDFKSDFKKKHRLHIPNQMYYMVHPSIVEKVQASGLLTTEGLLTVNPESNHYYTNLHYLLLLKPARKTHSKKLGIRQLVELVKAQTGTLVKLASQNVHLERRTAPPGNMLAYSPSA